KGMLLKADYGEQWAGLVGAWWQLEKASGFVCNNPTPHDPTGRPKEIGFWVKAARKSKYKVCLETFPQIWWGWWTFINPAWRVREGKLVRDGEGSWEDLRCPGQNGFLNVVVCLQWWRASLETPSEDWIRAVDDVTWVVEKM
ncbi:hypothetical protein C8R47DRAFT_949050, partial [Mycena vitilis]